MELRLEPQPGLSLISPVQPNLLGQFHMPSGLLKPAMQPHRQAARQASCGFAGHDTQPCTSGSPGLRQGAGLRKFSFLPPYRKPLLTAP